MSNNDSFNVPLVKGITNSMNMSLKPSAPKSRSYRVSHNPVNKNLFKPEDQAIIQLNTGKKNTFYDPYQSYLKLTTRVKTTTAKPVDYLDPTAVFLENTAYNLIQKIDVYNGSNLIEPINEYGQLCNKFIDMSVSQSEKAAMSAMIGSNPYTVFDYSSVMVNNASGNLTGIDTTGYNVCMAGDRSGLAIETTTALSTSPAYTFCLPLLSGSIGINASKMIPIELLNNPMEIQIYFAALNDAFCCGTSGLDWEITNVEFVACYVEIFEDMGLQLNQSSPVFISTKSFRHSTFFLPSGSVGEYTALLNFRCASLCAIYGVFRNDTTAANNSAATAAYRKSSSVNPCFSSYYFRCDMTHYPNKPVSLRNGAITGGASEAFTELQKSLHSLSSPTANGSILRPQYNVSVETMTGYTKFTRPTLRADADKMNLSNYAFTIGQEFETLSNKSDVILSGINTLNNQVYFTGIIDTALPGGLTADFFAEQDLILVFLDGQVSARS